MARETQSGGHRRRLENWQRLSPPATRYLCALVDSELVPSLEKIGFTRAEYSFGDKSDPVSGREIQLERSRDASTEYVLFNFEKYRTPRFQIHFGVRGSEMEHIRQANLVSKRGQYYHFWGRPWWLPTRLWSAKCSDRAIAKVKAHLLQLVEFIETGSRGANISRVVSVQLAGQRDRPASGGSAR